MPLITVSRQLGSQGDVIAKKIADLLEYDYVDKELFVEVAQQANLPPGEVEKYDEKYTNPVIAFLKKLVIPGNHPVTEIPEWTILCEEEQVDQKQIQNQKECLEFFRSTIEQLWERGNTVIVGRGGQIVLRDKKDVFHVRVIASLEYRLEQLMKEREVDRTSAAKLIKSNDRRKANYIKYGYKEDWNNPELYHLIVNMGEGGVEFQANFISDTALKFINGGSN